MADGNGKPGGEESAIARPYAQALIELAGEEERFEQWSGMLAILAEIAAHPDMRALLSDPEADRSLILSIFTELAGDELDQEGHNLIALLVENDRCLLLGEISRLYEQLRRQHLRQRRALIISARPLDDSQIEAFRQKLIADGGGEAEIECRVDESLIGGAIIRIGDEVIDGSIRGRLRQLAETIN